MQGVQGSALRDAYFNFWDKIENLYHWIPCFEARMRNSLSLSHTSRRKREFYRRLRNGIENFSHYILRFESRSRRCSGQFQVQVLASLHRDMFFYPYLRWTNALVWLVKSYKSNVFPKLQAISLDKRKASHGVNSNQTNTITPPNSVAIVTCVTFFKCSS